MKFQSWKKKGDFSYFLPIAEKRENFLYCILKKIGKFSYKFQIGKKGFKKGNSISPFSKPFWPELQKMEIK